MKSVAAVDIPPHSSDEPLELQSSDAISAVKLGLWVSATRCVMTYVFAPAMGALGVFLGPFGELLQILGAVTATYGARNLFVLRHRWRYAYAVIAAVVVGIAVLGVAQMVQEVLR